MTTKSYDHRTQTESAEPEGVQSVEKALTVLDAFAEGTGHYPMTLAELTRRVGMHRSSVNRWVASLVRSGYLQVEASTGKYELAPKVLRLSQKYIQHSGVAARAQQYLVQLRNQTGETAFLSLLVGDRRVTVSQEESYQGLRRTMEIGVATPLHCSAASKAILAFASPDLVERILGGPLEKCGPAAVTDPAILRRTLQTIRGQGFAIGQDEMVEGAGGACAPVFNYRSEVVGSIGLAVPSPRFAQSRRSELAENVRRAAASLSKELGFSAAF